MTQNKSQGNSKDRPAKKSNREVATNSAHKPRSQSNQEKSSSSGLNALVSKIGSQVRSQEETEGRTSQIKLGAVLITAMVIVAVVALVIIAFHFTSLGNSTPEQAAKTAVHAMVKGDAKQWCAIIEPELKVEVEKSLQEMNKVDKDFMGIENDSCEEYAAQLFSILDSAGNVVLDEEKTTYKVISENDREALVSVHLEGQGINREDTTIDLVNINGKWYLKAGSEQKVIPDINDNPSQGSDSQK